MTDNHVVYLGLGSNLGDKPSNIWLALEKIKELVGDVVRQSTLYVTQPWGFESENSFVNAVVCCHTSLSPRKLLTATQKIERDLGRTEKSENGVYHDRVIDIDILLYDHRRITYPDLTIPHPLMWERDFVMTPLREIMPPEELDSLEKLSSPKKSKTSRRG